MTTTWQDTLNIHITLKAIDCCSCGVPFAMPADLLQWFQEHEDRYFYCPNGHQQHFTESEATRLRRKLADAEAARDRAREGRRHAEAAAEAERLSHRATKGQLTRARRRVVHGVCPVDGCRRSFPDAKLTQHLATVHPDYVATADRDAGRPAPEPGGVKVDGPYGSMRKHHAGQGTTRYLCACGLDFSTGGGAAARHARTCPKAREPWPTKGGES